MRKKAIAMLLAIGSLLGCGPGEAPDPATLPLPDIIASNAFYYYEDLDTAWAFYRDTLGFETVVDYGFAKILRVADSSYLTLVNAADGMHSSAEPKTVALTLLTNTLPNWHAYLGSQGIVTRISFDPRRDKKPVSFAIEDPEGYLLRFESAVPGVNGGSLASAPDVEPLMTSVASDDNPLDVNGTIYAVYMENFDDTLAFYRRLFGKSELVGGAWAAVFEITPSSHLALVDGADDLHSPTEQNGVTLSFFTSDVDGWFERARNIEGFELRADEIFDESGMVRVFVGYDPEGYFLEWDTFGERADNRILLRYLNR